MLQEYFEHIKYMLREEIFKKYFGWRSIFNKTVADVSHRLDINVIRVFYFAPESTDVNIYRPISTEIVFTPDLVQ
jgi:hypothetical protein